MKELALSVIESQNARDWSRTKTRKHLSNKILSKTTSLDAVQNPVHVGAVSDQMTLDIPDDLKLIIYNWSEIPKCIKDVITALIESYNEENN